MTNRDWTLLALAAAKGDAIGPMQLQKALFLLGESGLLADSGFYEFSTHHYGPLSVEIYRDAEALEREGLAVIYSSDSVRQYRASYRGVKCAVELAEKADPDALGYLERVMKWALPLSGLEVAGAVVARFPEYKPDGFFVA